MATYRLVPEEDWRALVDAVERAQEIVEKHADASRLEMKLPANDSARKQRPTPSEAESPGGRKKYRISRSMPYTRVVDEEVEENEFSLDEAWEIVRPLIETDAKRPRDGLRTALERDEKYERADRDGEIWYRRIDPEQTKLTRAHEDESPATAVRTE